MRHRVEVPRTPLPAQGSDAFFAGAAEYLPLYRKAAEILAMTAERFSIKPGSTL